MRDVCPSVRLSSVEIISFRGIRGGSQAGADWTVGKSVIYRIKFTKKKKKKKKKRRKKEEKKNKKKKKE